MDYLKFIREVRSSNLPTSEKLVIIMIASHFDFTKGEPAYPSNKTLSDETGLSVRSVVRAKNTLVETGWLVSQRQYNNVCLYIPMVPKSIPYGQERPLPIDTNDNINTHINTQLNTHRNTNINKNVSNETLVSSINIIPEEVEDITMIPLDTNEDRLAEVTASPAAAQIIEEDWLSW
jgi:DNA-binding transcriptional MocR family regulator